MKAGWSHFLAIALFLGGWQRIGLAATTELDLSLKLYGNGSNQGLAESRIAGTEIGAEWRRALAEKLTLEAGALAILETGSSRQLVGNEENRPRQGLRLRQASLSFSPIQEIEIAAGAMDQDRWQQPMLLHRQSFPALYERLELGEKLFARIEATQAYASDTSTLQPWNQVGEGSAAFYYERASVGYRFDQQNEISLLAGHYLFQNLSPQLAYQSRFFGNSVTGTASTNSAFPKPFRGWELGAQTRVALSATWTTGAGLSWLTNPEGTANETDTWRGRLFVEWVASAAQKWKTEIEYFEAGSDVSPAAFNSRARGHNNRKGYGIALQANFSDFEVGAEWIDSRLRSPNAFQDDYQWIQLSLRTQHDVL